MSVLRQKAKRRLRRCSFIEKLAAAPRREEAEGTAIIVPKAGNAGGGLRTSAARMRRLEATYGWRRVAAAAPPRNVKRREIRRPALCAAA